MQRFGVSGSVGSRDGKRFAVWDRETHQVVSWHQTFKQAKADAKQRNLKGD